MALATRSYDLYPHLAKLLGIPDGLAVRKLVLSLGVDETPILTLETIAGRDGEVEKQEYELRPVANADNSIPLLAE